MMNNESQITIKIKQATKKGYIELDLPGIADFNYPNSKTRRGRVQGRGQICPTITTENGMLFIIESAKGE